MNQTEHSAKQLSLSHGRFAVSLSSHRVKGRSASVPRWACALLVGLGVFLGLFVAEASALQTRQLRFQITEAAGAPFAGVKGLAVDSSDRLWAADPADHAVERFGPTGTYEAQDKGEGAWETSAVKSLAFSAAVGEVFVADPEGDHLWGLDPATAAPTGKDLTPLGASSFNIEVAADNSPGATGGDLYVSTGFTLVRVKASDGSPDPFTCAPGPDCVFSGNELTGPFAFAESLAVAPNGDLYVGSENSNVVYEFSPSGELIGEITEGGGQPLESARALAFDPTTGTLFVGTGAERIFEFDSAGAFQRFIAKPAGAKFHVLRGLAVDSSGDLYAAEQGDNKFPQSLIDAFTPLLTLPAPTTGPAQVHSTTTATLEGEVDPAGLPLTGCFFEYGETTAYGQTAECEPEAGDITVDEEEHPVVAQIAGLTPSREYHYRLVAANSEGTNSESEDRVLFTGATVDATSASEVTDTTALLETELNPHGDATSFHFEYDTVPYAEGEAPHGTATATQTLGAGTTALARSAPIGGLRPDTVYHFRVLVETDLGAGPEVILGPDRSFTTQGPVTNLLPDSRAYELVSPADKHGAPLEAIAKEGGLIQAAADGSAISYFAKAPVTTEPQGSRSAQNSQLLSSRSPSAGWQSQDIATPHREAAGVVPGNPSEYQLFSTGLDRGLHEPEGATPLVPQAGEPTPYLRAPDGSYAPLVTEANVPPNVPFGGNCSRGTCHGSGGVEFITATPDLSHLLLRSPQPLTADFSPSFLPKGNANIFEWEAGHLRLVSWIPVAPATACGPAGPACQIAAEAGQGSAVGYQGLQLRDAISVDGSRVIFQQPGGKLYLRDLASEETLQLDAPDPSCPSCSGGSGAIFQLASTDGRRIFFTDAAKLTEDSTAAVGKPDLYMCEVEESPGLACDLTDLTANALHPAEPANVQGVVRGAAEDGSSVYFTAAGALTAGAPSTTCVQEPGRLCNLYRYQVGSQTTTLIATLSSSDEPDWFGAGGTNLGEVTSRVSPDGRYLAFMSSRPLTGYDNRDAKSGVRDEEVFLYDSQSEKLACASCNPTGARPAGKFDPNLFPGLLVDRPRLWGETTGFQDNWLAANVPGWTRVDILHSLYQSRYLSDSGRLFFNAADALVPSDTNATFDVYQFEFPQGPGQPASDTCTAASSTYSPRSGGCVSLISSGTSPQESAFMDASESGDDIFFLTVSKLTPRDVDGAYDLYDARVGGGEPEVVKPVECSGDACQQPAVPPNDATPGSLTFNGAGNELNCPKGKVKKNGKCVKQKSKKKHHKKTSHKKQKKSKRANPNRGGAK